MEDWKKTPCIPGTNIRKWYVRHYGSLPRHIYVCHHCDNPGCCNIEHIFLGTQSENMQDCIDKGRFTGKKGIHCSEETKKIISIANKALSPEDVKFIRDHPEIHQYYLAKKFNVSGSTIYRVRKGEV